MKLSMNMKSNHGTEMLHNSICVKKYEGLEKSSMLILWCLATFGISEKKTPKRTWLCVGISLVRSALQTW